MILDEGLMNWGVVAGVGHKQCKWMNESPNTNVTKTESKVQQVKNVAVWSFFPINYLPNIINK